jgi:hypothetical protein
MSAPVLAVAGRAKADVTAVTSALRRHILEEGPRHIGPTGKWIKRERRKAGKPDRSAKRLDPPPAREIAARKGETP